MHKAHMRVETTDSCEINCMSSAVTPGDQGEKLTFYGWIPRRTQCYLLAPGNH